MGIYSTKTVSREYAIETLLDLIPTASNDLLGQLLFYAIGDETLNNFIVEDEV